MKENRAAVHSTKLTGTTGIKELCVMLTTTRTAAQVDDGLLSFGVVSHPLRALESMVRTVYRPTLQGQDNRLWGKAPPDLVHEFMVGLDGFVDNLQVRGRDLTTWT